MPSREIEIVNKLGMHLRAAAAFVQLAESFPCKVSFMRDDGQRANGKSILSVLSLGAANGVKMTLETTGDRADEALEKLGQFVAEKFGEPE